MPRSLPKLNPNTNLNLNRGPRAIYSLLGGAATVTLRSSPQPHHQRQPQRQPQPRTFRYCAISSLLGGAVTVTLRSAPKSYQTNHRRNIDIREGYCLPHLPIAVSASASASSMQNSAFNISTWAVSATVRSSPPPQPHQLQPQPQPQRE